MKQVVLAFCRILALLTYVAVATAICIKQEPKQNTSISRSPAFPVETIIGE